MRDKTIAFIAVIAVLSAVAFYFNLFSQTASKINHYDEAQISRIDISEVQSDINHTIDDRKMISSVLAILKSDYKVKRISEKQERGYMLNPPPKLIITVLIGEYEIVDMYFVTQGSSIIIADTASMQGDSRTALFKSVEEHPKIIEKLMNIIEKQTANPISRLYTLLRLVDVNKQRLHLPCAI